MIGYKEASAVLTLADVWDMAPNPNNSSCPIGAKVVKSPFQEDRKGKSFSVTADLKAFRDHRESSHRGGVYKFIELARPEWTKQQIVRHMITLAGGDPDEKDPNWRPKPKSQYYSELKMLKDSVANEIHFQNTVIGEIEPDKLRKIPPFLAKFWESCVQRAENKAFLDRISQERGWPLEWVRGALVAGKIGVSAYGEVVFPVELSPDGWLNRCIGVHIRSQKGRSGPRWWYRPNSRQDGQEVAPLPFYVGDVGARFWVVCEGQWDALTAYGLLGGFDPLVTDFDICCFGIRGSTGTDAFLKIHKERLRNRNPSIVLVPDADRAASGWIECTPKRWSFARRLREIFNLSNVKAFKIVHRRDVKDLNDFYRAGCWTLRVEAAFCNLFGDL